MKEKPILFSGPMVRAILDGRKSQTRRVIKPQPEAPAVIYNMPNSNTHIVPTLLKSNRGMFVKFNYTMTKHGAVDCPLSDWASIAPLCPYGQPGDRLWVKETHAFVHFDTDPESGYSDDWYGPSLGEDPQDEFWSRLYRADYTGSDEWPEDTEERGFKWTPSIFMPRWASRIDLEVTDIRVERVQEMQFADIRNEGLDCPVHDFASGFCSSPCADMARAWVDLWDSINSKRGYSWESNPWVWVVEFRRIRP